ncbi:hypothetical protein, partial [Amycolatopsis sp. MtRt-6]|uniref:hypothetical protein n=1 Tax=Amycolatopsis sp. MtRt-6 TaxID=2792782 RepID=UPI001A8FBC05
MAFGAFNAPNVAFGAFNAPNATLGLFHRGCGWSGVLGWWWLPVVAGSGAGTSVANLEMGEAL